MKYQITVKKNGTSLEALFAHGALLDLETFPFAVGIGPSDAAYYALPGSENEAPGKVAEFCEEKNALVLVCRGNTLAVRLNGTDISLVPGESLPLKNGDRLDMFNATMRIYRAFGRPGTSFLCNALVYSVAVLAVLFFLLEAAALIGLPIGLHHSSSWNSYRDRQMISREIDAMRKEMKQDDGSTVLQHAILAALNEELTSQASYFRANYAGMSRKQRREMLDNLKRMRDYVHHIQENLQSDQPLKPNVDAAVKTILRGE